MFETSYFFIIFFNHSLHHAKWFVTPERRQWCIGKTKPSTLKILWNLAIWIKAWLGYSKGLSHFIFIVPFHLNMLLKLNDTFTLKVWFYLQMDTLQRYYYMHRMFNLIWDYVELRCENYWFLNHFFNEN
jgi:hypothetical protein